MNKTVKSLLVGAACALISITSIGAYGQGCNALEVVLAEGSWSLFPGRCEVGRVDYESKNKVVLYADKELVKGPECTIHFFDSVSGTSVSADFQQDLCVLGAGNITVKPGYEYAPVFTQALGVYTEGKPGQVTIQGFSTAKQAESVAQN